MATPRAFFRLGRSPPRTPHQPPSADTWRSRQDEPVVRQRMKMEEPMAQGGIPTGPRQVTRQTTYTSYTSMELRDLAKQCKQRMGESIPAWLLRLWDDGADQTELSPKEMSQLASITTVPSLRQRLQTIPQSNADAGNHTLISWLMAAVRTVWESAGDLPEHVSKWTTYLDLAQVIREMGMRQMMFSLHFRSPANELLTARIKDLILANGPTETFGTMAALLAPYVDRPIHEVTEALARLGDIEVRQKWVRAAKTQGESKTPSSRAVTQKGKSTPRRKKGNAPILGGPQKLDRRQIWCDLLAAGLARVKLDGQPLEVLVALWKKLQPEQQYTPLPTSHQAREVAFADFLPD
ncbi:uncharacterized protein [Vicugna pacos]|uniref:Uncharacterized protein n=1 Tax=Vicugna pacos TaxID=30538 RepID=A0ABM5D9X7_VICPA